MAALTRNTFTGQQNTVTKEDLNAGPHTLPWLPNTSLVFESTEALTLTINAIGDGVTTVPCSGYGDVDVSAGFDISLTTGDTVVVPLSSISAFLGQAKNNVTLTVTGSTAADLAFVYWY
jgi:hypothetical protein